MLSQPLGARQQVVDGSTHTPTPLDPVPALATVPTTWRNFLLPYGPWAGRRRGLLSNPKIERAGQSYEKRW